MLRTKFILWAGIALLGSCTGRQATPEERAKYAQESSHAPKQETPDTSEVEEIEIEMGNTIVVQEPGRPPKLSITTSTVTEIPSVMNFTFYKTGTTTEQQKTTITVGNSVIVEYSRNNLLPSKTELLLTTGWTLINPGCDVSVLHANSEGHLIEVYLKNGVVTSVGVAGTVYSNSAGVRGQVSTDTAGFHIVQRNETLAVIARRYNLDLNCLIAKYPGSLSVGKKIDLRECQKLG